MKHYSYAARLYISHQQKFNPINILIFYRLKTIRNSHPKFNSLQDET